MKRKIITVALTLALIFMTAGGTLAIYSAKAEETTYYVCFSDSNYSKYDRYKLERDDESGEYFLRDVRLSSSVGFNVQTEDGVKYALTDGKDLKVEDSAVARYDIKFSPSAVYSTEALSDDDYKKTDCHVTYKFHSPESVQVEIGTDDGGFTATDFKYNGYQNAYDVYYYSATLSQGTVVKKTTDGEEETHTAETDGEYRILYTPGSTRQGQDYLFNKDGVYGTGDGYEFHIYMEKSPLYYLSVEGGTANKRADTEQIDGKDYYKMVRREANVAAEEYRVGEFFFAERDSSFRFKVWQKEPNGNMKLIDDDNDEDTETSKITVADVGWYEYSFTATSGRYVSAVVEKERRFGGYYAVGDFNGYCFESNGDVNVSAKYAFSLVEKDDDDFNEDYEQYKLELEVTRKDLKDGDFEFYISDGKNKYKNGTEYIKLNVDGKYKVLFSPDHLYTVNNRYRASLIDENKDYDEIRISTVEEYEAFADKCSQSATYSQKLSVYLTADLDFSGREFKPVKQFYGKFYGGYHSLKNIVIESDKDEASVFNFVTKSAAIERLSVYMTIKSDENDYAGFVARNYGTLRDISVYGEVWGKNYVGGVCAYNGVSKVDESSPSLDSANVSQYGKIIGCKNNATVKGRSNVGGIVGFSSGEILGDKNADCVNYGTVTPDTMRSNVTFTNIGGIAGFSAGKIAGAINEGKVGVNAIGVYVGGISGYNTGEVYYSSNHGEIVAAKYAGGCIGGYGVLAENKSDSAGYFGGLDYNAILKKYFNGGNSDTSEVVDGGKHAIDYAINNGRVKANSYVGGLVGVSYRDGTDIRYGYSVADLTCSTGDYLGGILGSGNTSTVTSCFASGTFTADGSNSSYVGGIVGYAKDVHGCMSNAELFGKSYVGGIAGKIVGNISSCYTNVTIGDDAKESGLFGAIAGDTESFSSASGASPSGFTCNYYIGGIGGIGGADYSGAEFNNAATPIKKAQLLSKENISSALAQEFDHALWRGGKTENGFPVLTCFYEAEDLAEFDEDGLFAKFESDFEKCMDDAAQATVSVVFMEWNEDKGDLYDDDGKLSVSSFEKIYSVRTFDGNVDYNSVAFKFAKNENGQYVFRGNDAVYFVKWKAVSSGDGDTIMVYADYEIALSTIEASGTTSALIEGLFREGTQATVVRLGDYYTVRFTLDGAEYRESNYVVKWRVDGKPESYVVSAIDENNNEKTIESKASGDNYVRFEASDGTYFKVIEKHITGNNNATLWLIIALCVSASGLIVAIVFICVLGKKLKRKSATESVSEQTDSNEV